MNAIIARLKFEGKKAAEKSRSIGLEVQSLKYVGEGTAKKYQELRRTKVEPEVQSVFAKVRRAALKAMRNPSTGQKRYGLWNDKRSWGSNARYYNLSLGFLRGIPYRKIERASHNPPSYTLILAYVKDAAKWCEDNLGLSSPTWTGEAIKAWLSTSCEVAAAA
jgi:hypothetical protein